MRHDCQGEECGYCESRIAAIEYERDFGYDDPDSNLDQGL